MTKPELKKFFADRPSLSIKKIGEEAGYSEGRYLREVLNKDGDTLPPLMQKKLAPILKKYGYGNAIV